jgi:MFS family permease
MLAPLRNRNFALLWLGGMISFAGDWAMLIALPVFIYDLTGSAMATGGAFIALSLPRLLFASLAGVFVDRWDRRRTMIIANLLSAAVLLLLLPVHAASQFWLVYAVAFLHTTLSLFFMPAESALVPALVPEPELLQANALLALNWELMRLIAPPLGGLAMVALGFHSAVVIDAISFLAAAALFALLAPGERLIPAAADGTGALRRVARELGEGAALVRRSGPIRAIFVVVGVAMVAEGVLNVLGFPWLKQVLNGGALERGWLTSAQAVGGLLGGVLIGRVARQVRTSHLIGASGVILGLLTLAYANVTSLPLPPTLWLPAALFIKVLQGLPVMGMFVSVDTLLQQSVADRFRGRVFGAYGAAVGLATLFGQTLASLLGDRVNVVTMLDMVGLLYMGGGLLALALLHSYQLRAADPRPAAELA